MLEVLGGLAVVGLLAFGLGHLVAIRVGRQGRVTPAIRRFHALGRRIVMILTVVFYGWVIYEVDWPRVIRSGFGLRDMVLIDEARILLPFLLAQGLVLWGFFAAERALRPLEAAVQPIGLCRYLVLGVRQSMGLVLPVAAVFTLGQDLFRWQWPQAAEGSWAHPIGLAAMGAIVLVLSPAFIRLAWPTRPLPPGPLRDRLERVAARFGFRCTDILVWDTGVRPDQCGRHGGPALVPLRPADRCADRGNSSRSRSPRSSATRSATSRIGTCSISASSPWGASASCAGRRGDRRLRGDVAGVPRPLGRCLDNRDRAGGRVRDLPGPVLPAGLRPRLAPVRAAGRRLRVPRRSRAAGADCPPHVDWGDGDGQGYEPGPLCPAGIRIFAAALANVAMLNGMERRKRSWRHGSIQRRIEFLEGLVGKPESERRFQIGVSRLRVARGAGLDRLGGARGRLGLDPASSLQTRDGVIVPASDSSWALYAFQ